MAVAAGLLVAKLFACLLLYSYTVTLTMTLNYVVRRLS